MARINHKSIGKHIPLYLSQINNIFVSYSRVNERLPDRLLKKLSAIHNIDYKLMNRRGFIDSFMSKDYAVIAFRDRGNYYIHRMNERDFVDVVSSGQLPVKQLDTSIVEKFRNSNAISFGEVICKVCAMNILLYSDDRVVYASTVGELIKSVNELFGIKLKSRGHKYFRSYNMLTFCFCVREIDEPIFLVVLRFDEVNKIALVYRFNSLQEFLNVPLPVEPPKLCKKLLSERVLTPFVVTFYCDDLQGALAKTKCNRPITNHAKSSSIRLIHLYVNLLLVNGRFIPDVYIII